MNTAESWAVLLGLATPLIVSAVSNPRLSSQARRFLAIGIAVVVGVVNLAVQGAFETLAGGLTWETALSTLVLVVGASQAAYALLWKPTGVADRVEGATPSPIPDSDRARE